uniref:NR LBD domain-containing protein n=1 Tax=Mesocestoides corti TaxID=53468 RepID=A0A5K3FCD7_MESCO
MSRKESRIFFHLVMWSAAVQDERCQQTSGFKRRRPHPTSRTVQRLEVFTVDDLVAAEVLFQLPDGGDDDDVPFKTISGTPPSAIFAIAKSAEALLSRLVRWARSIPAFTSYLDSDDQQCLLNSAWLELLLVSLAFRSSNTPESMCGLLLASRYFLPLEVALTHPGLGPIVNQVLDELVAVFRELVADRTEVALMKAIVLFNSDVSGVCEETVNLLEDWQDCLSSSLQAYCSKTYDASGPSRFTKLILRLTSLRSISLRCRQFLASTPSLSEDDDDNQSSLKRLQDLCTYGIWPQ